MGLYLVKNDLCVALYLSSFSLSLYIYICIIYMYFFHFWSSPRFLCKTWTRCHAAVFSQNNECIFWLLQFPIAIWSSNLFCIYPKHLVRLSCGHVGPFPKDPFERLWNLPDYVELKDQELTCTLCTVKLPTVTQMYMHLQGDKHHRKAHARKVPDVIWIQARNQLERLGSSAVFPLPFFLTFTFWTEVLTFSTLKSNKNAIRAFFLVVFG